MIRPLREEDAYAVGRLWEELVHYHCTLNPDMPLPAPQGAERYAQRILNRLHDDQLHVLVAEEEGRPVGFVLGLVVELLPDLFVQQRGGLLADLYVQPDYRRRGIGRELVLSMAAWFRSRGLGEYEWHVAAENQAGRAFWRALGGRDFMIRMRAELGDDNST